MRLTPYLAALVLILSSCSNRMVETSLYFGQSIPGGGKVTEQQWTEFRNKYVLNVFKEGATSIPVSGNWLDQNDSQMITEATYIVVYLHKPSPTLSRKIDELRETYKKMDGQQSVLRVDKRVAASF